MVGQVMATMLWPRKGRRLAQFGSLSAGLSFKTGERYNAMPNNGPTTALKELLASFGWLLGKAMEASKGGMAQ